MLTILTAVVCIHHVCLATIIPTPATLDEHACIHQGYWIALSFCCTADTPI
jgi:hypothetical protein